MATKKQKNDNSDRTELIQALDMIEKDRQIKKEVMIAAIEESLKLACRSQFGKSDNIRVSIDPSTGEIKVFADQRVVADDEVEDDIMQIGLTEARLRYNEKIDIDEVVSHEVTPKNFGRIAAQKAKQTVVQTIRQEERKVLYNLFKTKENDIITGVVQRYTGNNISVNLGRLDTILTESEQVKGEVFKPTEHIKLYVVEVKDTQKDPKVIVSRSHPDFVKRLLEEEVTEIQDGTVKIMNIAREAGSRTKVAVAAQNSNVDPLGACVGVNGSRINAIVKELHGEKIDVIIWSDAPDVLIENALSPASVITVDVDPEEKTAEVIVPDNQLSLAIGKEGQNARLAAKLTGYKIDISSESGL